MIRCAQNTDSKATVLRKAVDYILLLEDELRKYIDHFGPYDASPPPSSGFLEDSLKTEPTTGKSRGVGGWSDEDDEVDEEEEGEGHTHDLGGHGGDNGAPP